jgi:hypothetical protein
MEQRLTQEIDQETATVLREWYRVNGRLHREAIAGPAYVERNKETGIIIDERYYWNGKLHREGGPACLTRNLYGVATWEIYYRHGLVHRNPDEGPAYMERNWSGTVVTMEAYRRYGGACRHPNVGPWAIGRCPETGKVVSQQYLGIHQFFDPSRPPRRTHKRIVPQPAAS